MKVLVLIVSLMLLITIVWFSEQRCWASEAPTGSLLGTVVDAKTQEHLPGVNIIIVGTVLGTMTDRNGQYRLSKLPPGAYSVEALMIGYKSSTAKGVEIAAGEETTLDFKLQERAVEIPPVVVTASKRRQIIQESPISVDVIGTAELEQRNVVTLNQALRYAPGLDTKGGEIGIRASTGYSQGAGSRVLLLIDGNPAITGDTGGINWDAIPVTEIESVEIVKGAGSALYGSNALGGVINVITRKPREIPETRVRFSSGFYSKPYYSEWKWTDQSLDFNGIDLSHSRKLGNLSFLFSLGRKSSDGYRQNGDYLRWNSLGKFTYDFSPQTHLTFFSSWAKEDRGEFLQWERQSRALEVPGKRLGDRVYSDKLNANCSFNQLVNPKIAYILKTYYYWTYWKHRFYDSRNDSRAQRSGSELRVELLPSEGHSLTVGLEGTYDKVNSKMFGDHYAYDLAGYIQDEVKIFPYLRTTLGVRYDYHRVDTTFREDQISPKIGLVYRPSEITSLRASAGRGFRAASVAEMFTETVISGIRVIPNEDLRAESAWSYELGVNQLLGERLLLDLALFQNSYRDMIEVEQAGQGFRFANVTKARVRGGEIKLKVYFLRKLVTSSLSYTYIDPKDLKKDEILPYRSSHRFLSSLLLNYKNNQLGVDFRYHSRVEKVHEQFSRDERVPQYVVDARSTLNLGRFALSGKVDNLLQYHYAEVPRRLAPIRSYTLTLTTRF